jgi:hypothetical protein
MFNISSRISSDHMMPVLPRAHFSTLVGRSKKKRKLWEVLWPWTIIGEISSPLGDLGLARPGYDHGRVL